ncbi:uncharacterized protein LOC100200537 isoform X1 [Hydra vulgaris]|uniref:uncharacterized protein LOC100200537 isoform X1 n=1 Tax=Hydra vulgaris TaxID=6087 RepID=UPI00064155CF|nr:uncharacterized protein LOC100200537 [Hydra vulgaris]
MSQNTPCEAIFEVNKNIYDTYSGTLWREGKSKLKAYHCIIANGNFYCYKDPKSKKPKLCILMSQSQLSLEDDVKFIIDVSKKNKGYKFVTANQQDREKWSQQMLAAGSSVKDSNELLRKNNKLSLPRILPIQNDYVLNLNKKNKDIENVYGDVSHYEKLKLNMYELDDGESNHYEKMDLKETPDKTDIKTYENLHNYLNICRIDPDSSTDFGSQNQQSETISEENIYAVPKSTSENLYQNFDNYESFRYEDIDRPNSESLLSKSQKVGCFLIRHAKNDNKEVLSVLIDTNGIVKHYKIFELEGMHYLESTEPRFTTVIQMIRHYEVNYLPRCNICLAQPCFR